MPHSVDPNIAAKFGMRPMQTPPLAAPLAPPQPPAPIQFYAGAAPEQFRAAQTHSPAPVQPVLAMPRAATASANQPVLAMPRAATASANSLGVPRAATASANSLPSSIFIAGTTLTKEDVRLMELRHAEALDELRTQLQAERERSREQSTLLREMTAELDSARSRIHRSNAAMHDRDSRTAELSQQVESLTTILAAAEKDRDDARAELKQAKRAATAATEESSSLREEVQETRRVAAADAKEVAQLRTLVQKQEKEVSQVREHYDVAVKEGGAQLAELDQCHDKLAQQKRVWEAMAAALERMKSDLSTAEADLLRVQQTQSAAVISTHSVMREHATDLASLICTVRDLRCAVQLTGAGLADEQAPAWDDVLAKLQALAVSAPPTEPPDTPYLRRLAALVDAGSDGGTEIDVDELRKEVQLLRGQQAKDDLKNGQSLSKLETAARCLREAAAATIGAVRSLGGEVVAVQRRAASASEEAAAVELRCAPALERVPLLERELEETRRAVAAAQARASEEADKARLAGTQSDGVVAELRARAAEAEQRRDAAECERERMKAFMSRLPLRRTGSGSAAASSSPLQRRHSNESCASSAAGSRAAPLSAAGSARGRADAAVAAAAAIVRDSPRSRPSASASGSEFGSVP
eukprot:TRINITY_DN12051_c1_g1_i1.p1 TRINITY_DN12051_c1_g1~~TRINITY_DN12051_c1_g1_i1.p1  ORF type:complete len:642 (+),score=262.44 TRINITY_DN12051_c1_g1_i1:47-1972(+)